MKHPLADCANCPLQEKSYYQQPLRENVKYLFVGGGPNDQEAFKGGFFHTPAGRLVNSVCSFHNIDRNDVTYASAVACSGLSDLSIRDRRKAVTACNGVLFDQIDIVDPKAVVTFGNEALLGVTGKTGVTSQRVGPARHSQHTDCPVVSTVSPWACIAQESQFKFLVTDIGKLVNPAPQFTTPEYVVIEDADSAEALLESYVEDSLRGEPSPLVLDIEVAMEKDINFEHPDRFDMLCIGLKYANHPIVVFTADALSKNFYEWLNKLAYRSKVIAHNGKFDLAGLYSSCGEIDLDFDTMLASYVFDERSGIHGLKYLAQEYLGAPAYDDEVTALVGPKKDFSTIPKDILYKYNAYDIHCTFLLWLMYEKRFELEPELRAVHDFLVRASNMLRRTERNGLTIDEDYLEELEVKYGFILKVMRDDLRNIAIGLAGTTLDPKLGFNPNSYQQIGKVFTSQSIKLPSTNVENLEKVINYNGELPQNDSKVREFAKTLLQYRKEVKLSGTYVNGTRERLYQGRVHPTYLIHGTTTGRLSCRNPNVQNIPRKSPIKRLFVASAPNRSIIQSDFSQAELRTISFLAQDEYFRAIFNDPTRDVFDELVPELFEGSVKVGMDEAVWKEERTMVKTYVYGLSYGRTEYGIARGFGIDVEVAREHMRKFFSVIPKIIAWQEDIKRRVHDGLDLVTPFGRHRRYSLITPQNEQNVMNEALAFLPQSTASDITLQAAIWLDEMFIGNWSPERRPKIINLIHDAIMVDCLDEDITYVTQLMEQTMIDSAVTVVGDYVKFTAESSSAKTWGDLK